MAESKKEKINLTPDVSGADVPTAVITRDVEVPERKDYVVTAEPGLFKNGKQYNKGETVSLDEETAARFKENGEVEDAS